MKRFQLILVSVFTIIIAQAQLSQLDLSTSNQQPFDLYFDGQLLASEVAQVSLGDITPGNHQLQIVQSFRNNWGNGFGNQNGQRLYNGTVNISPNTLIQAVVHHNQFIIQNQTALAPVQSGNGHYGNNNHPSNNGNHYGNGNHHQGNNGNYNPYAGGQGNHYGNGYDNVNPYNGHGYGQGYGQNPNYIPGGNTHWNVPAPQPAPACPNTQQPVYSYGPQAMDPAAFQQLLATINNQWFSSGQMNVFKQAAATNYFTSQQVRDIVQQFTFSSDQLKVAKKAYTRTVDPQNYFVVNDALEFNSSVNALSAYIASL